MTDRATVSAVSAPTPGPSGGGDDQDALEFLQSVVRTARAIFGARASSAFLLDLDTDELVFQAVSGEGESSLIGRRFPAGRGIAGWVAMSGEPMVVSDVSTQGTFDRELAESTNFVPQSLMAAPLEFRGRVLGVLEVLDPVLQDRSGLSELDLLMLFANQAAGALQMVVTQRAGGQAELRSVVESVRAMPSDTRATGVQLLDALRELLQADG